MKLYLTLLVFLFATSVLYAQSSRNIKGTVIDTSANVKLVNTTICVLNAKDSIMRKFTYAKADGSFNLDGLPAGNFIFLASFPQYADYVETFTLDAAHPTHDFGTIHMQLKSKLLHDVIIKGAVTAIKIKGDTTEFNAKAYVIQPNDKVEDLLKQMPGIQIDKDGKITANGQTISKVLVDGEEFFGDDPTLVTKNIRSDMVDKVQLFDKKSDQATFTGIDDGQRTKTINIVLKQDKKQGTFGKLDGGIGTKDYYEGQAIFNRFKAKYKYSAYATAANDGKTGLSSLDNNNIGASSNNTIIGDDGGIITYIGGGDGLDSYGGNYNGSGKPKAYSGGVHFDDKWNGDKQAINTNYKIGSIDVRGVTTTDVQQNLTTGLINTKSAQNFDNYAFRQRFDANYQLKIDTTSNLRLSVDGTFKNFTVKNDYTTASLNGNGKQINGNSRVISNDGDQQLFNASSFYSKRFKKAGRTFSWNLVGSYNKNITKGYLNSETGFYNATTGVKDSSQTIDQYKTSNTLATVVSSNMSYSEPISKLVSMVFNYGLGVNNSTADRRSFNQSAPGVYNVQDNVFSNDYKFLQITNQLGASVNYHKTKVNLNLGLKGSNVDFKQVDEFTQNIYRRGFINWAPQANFSYRPSLQRSVSFYYNGSSVQPTLDQIQPVNVNTDPLNTTLGNADLKPAFRHNLSVSYNTTKALSGASTYLYGNISTTTDAIVNNTVTSGAGKSTIRYLNLTNKNPINYFFYIDPSRKIKGISVGLDLSTNGNIGYSYINNALNMSESYSYSASLSLSKYVAKRYSFSASGGPSYSINKFSIQSSANNDAAGFNAYGNAQYYFPAKFNIQSNIRYNYTAKTQAFEAQYISIWSATLTKTFFKEDNLALAVSASDLLNQNRNTYRNAYANTITQTTNTGIGRYFLFTVIWNFTKFGTEPEKK